MKIEILISIFLVLIGYLITFFYKLFLARRSDKLRFIEKQINEFYGPLYITCKVSEIIFNALWDKRKSDGVQLIHDDTAHPTSEWRIWVENVFIPLNKKGQNIIIDNAHLIREKEVPKCLLKFTIHASGYEALIKKWEKGDFSEKFSFFRYPENLMEYAERSYLELKEEQLKLLGKL